MASREGRADAGRWCQRCGLKYAQDAGFCRSCARAEGVYGLTTREAEAERVATMAAKDASLVRVLPAPKGPKRIRVIKGVEYEVVWDGT